MSKKISYKDQIKNKDLNSFFKNTEVKKNEKKDKKKKE